MRTATTSRKTKETDIIITLDILEPGKVGGFTGTSGIGFFDHMLNSFCTHGGFALRLDCKGDLEVDGHHTVEDIGIVLGNAFTKALGNRVGIARFGQASVPMDEALSTAVLDISGRPFLVFDASFTNDTVGTYDTALTEEFFRAFAFASGITLHIKNEYGGNDHHKIESVFKSVARALAQAVRIISDQIPSSKGVI
ncbi:MAG: imidazoleglycerol-phosphate dehydratase [Clostridiales bacterium GWF2_38_85]|nr:MAG: imidazoleglycerol-phosphate dehydratase [Clostridiales bacterium GWF2_38_85]HBL84261.1 imidazoleglycerol-phosphate dehydratase HisB [Clostridiales bacterium]